VAACILFFAFYPFAAKASFHAPSNHHNLEELILTITAKDSSLVDLKSCLIRLLPGKFIISCKLRHNENHLIYTKIP
jgi:hypothetical protein